MSAIDPDILNEFLVEAREHLTAAEETILVLEREGDATDAETVNRLFRALHTIKGGAGFLGMTSIRDLSHAMENVIGKIRDKSLHCDARVCEPLLAGLDKLGTLLDNPTDAGADVAGEVSAVEAVLADNTSRDMRGPVADAALESGFNLSDYDFTKAIVECKTVIVCVFDMARDCIDKGKDPAGVLGDIRAVGDVIAMHPQTVNAGHPDLDAQGRWLCRFILATVVDEPDILTGGLEITPLFVRAYTSEQISELKKEPNPSGASQSLPASLRQAVDGTDAGARKQGSLTEEPKDASTPGRTAAPLTEQSIRIPLPLLDRLMNMASELVLVRNQNMQALTARDLQKLAAVNQRLNLVTTDLQNCVMQTRMRPVGTIFNRFTRVIRDLARKLEKQVDLEIIGGDVELDKTIIEAISDPLTHLIRNAIDHGIEMPQVRIAANKSPVGHVRLRAFHQAGMVNIEISDDGKGMDPEVLKRSAVTKKIMTEQQAAALSSREALALVFAPGFSTAEKVTEVSGRGVGMDVVKSRVQELGGMIDIASEPGKGSRFTIGLPLTLAVVPALIVAVEDHYFAIPQVNIDDVVWLHGEQVYQSIRKVDDREVYWLRGKLLPLVRLANVLKVKKTFVDENDKVQVADRREQAPDRRRQSGGANNDQRRTGPVERRISLANSLYIIVLSLGTERFGVLVDTIIDTEEIVVKSLHDQLKDCKVYAGTAVLGSGHIAMILDIPSLAALASFRFSGTESAVVTQRSSHDERQTVLLFDIGGRERFAVPLALISRVEEVPVDRIQIAGNREYLDFRGDLLPLIRIESAFPVYSASYSAQHQYVIIPKFKRPVGLMAARILDTIEAAGSLDDSTLRNSSIAGSQLINGVLTLYIDPFAIAEAADPAWRAEWYDTEGALRILLVDDSRFHRAMIGAYLRGFGMQITCAESGREALQLLKRLEFHAVVSDLEMPEMDGFDMGRTIKAINAAPGVPLIAVSSQDTPDLQSRACEAGFAVFHPKHDLQGLVKTLVELRPDTRENAA